MPHTKASSDTDMIPLKGTIKVPYARIGGFALSVMACVAVFQFFIPSKAAMEADHQELVELKRVQSADHDSVTKLSADVGYIRRWVEQQENRKGHNETGN